MLSADHLPLTAALNNHPSGTVVLSDGDNRRPVAYASLQPCRERPWEQIVPTLDVGEWLFRLAIEFIEQPDADR